MATEQEERARMEILRMKQLQAKREAALAAMNDEQQTNLVEGTAKVLDAPRAAIGGPLTALALEKISGKPVVAPGEGVMGGFPSTAKMLERAGYLEDYPLAREAVGFAGDIATDPTTYASFGASALSRAAQRAAKARQETSALKNGLMRLLQASTPVQTGIKEGAERLGMGTWKSAFKNLDILAKKKNQSILPSDILTEAGVANLSSRKNLEAMGSILSEDLAKRDAILAAARDANGVLDVDKAQQSLRTLQNQYSELASHGDENAIGIVANLKNDIQALEKYRPQNLPDNIPGPQYGGLPVDLGSQAKTLTYEDVPKGYWEKHAGTKTYERAQAAKSRGYKEGVEKGVGTALGPESEKELVKRNARIGSLLSTIDKEAADVGKEEAKNLFSQVDALNVGGLAAFGANPGYAGLKKAVEALNYQGPRSMLGKGLNRFGSSALVAPALLQTGKRSVWSILPKGDE